MSCYGEWQHLYSTIPKVRFVDGLPDESLFNSKTKNLVIIDDLMTETDGRVTNLFTKKSHHCNTSVVYLVQSMFSKNKESRTISRNAQYIVACKNPRDATQVTHLARQLYPGRVKYMQEAFKDATSSSYGYLLIDLKQETPNICGCARMFFRTRSSTRTYQRYKRRLGLRASSFTTCQTA